MQEKVPIILFDGVCNLCNSAVRFIIKYDSKKVFKFASLQSDLGAELQQQNLASDAFSTLLVYHDGKLLVKSNAALFIASRLDWPIKIVGIFYIVPTFIRNWCYDIIASNRYNWFGKRDTCMLPSPELLERFDVSRNGRK